MKARLAGLLATGLLLAACGNAPEPAPPEPELVGANALDGLLLPVNEVEKILAAPGLVAQPTDQTMRDNRNILQNLNCLGVWQTDESAIYGPEQAPDGWLALRQQTLRAPDTDDWERLAVQSVVSYPSTDAARAFFDQSADRWSQCTSHTVNVTLNDRLLPKWVSGQLNRTDTRLTMPVTRGVDAQTKQCERVLDVAVNVILDIQSCVPTGGTEAGAIADAIRAKIAG